MDLFAIALNDNVGAIGEDEYELVKGEITYLLNCLPGKILTFEYLFTLVH